MSKVEERKKCREKLVNVPHELKTLLNWVVYRMENRAGQSKPTKVPYSPTTGDHAKANDPSTWTDYETCVAAVERGEYDGVGFEFSPPYAGVDLDHCRDVETGVIEEWASESRFSLWPFTAYNSPIARNSWNRALCSLENSKSDILPVLLPS